MPLSSMRESSKYMNARINECMWRKETSNLIGFLVGRLDTWGAWMGWDPWSSFTTHSSSITHRLLLRIFTADISNLAVCAQWWKGLRLQYKMMRKSLGTDGSSLDALVPCRRGIQIRMEEERREEKNGGRTREIATWSVQQKTENRNIQWPLWYPTSPACISSECPHFLRQDRIAGIPSCYARQLWMLSLPCMARFRCWYTRRGTLAVRSQLGGR